MGNADSPFRVLSIDFDFFPDVSKKALIYYPDGLDLPTDISEIVWSTRYTSNGCPIADITINQGLYNQMLDILSRQSFNIPVMIANSHAKAYDFIIEYYNDKPIELCNVDFHHDLINGNEEMDCGNWISHLIHDYPVQDFKWIARKTAIDCYNIKKQEQTELHIEFDFQSIIEKNFDMVFLCRSDCWLPPHLDSYFDNMVKQCCKHFNNKCLRRINGLYV